MEIHRETEEITRRRVAQAAEDERRYRRRFLWVLLSFLASLAVGLALCAWGLHSTDPIMGPAIFEAGVLLANIGILITLLVAYDRLRD